MFKHIKQDIPAGITVFLVALPLCLGIALASGASPLSGLIAGIIGGTIVAAISGSPLGVSGPAAGLAIIVLESIKSFQNPKSGGEIPFDEAFSIFLTAVVIGGIIQALLGFLKAGIIGYYFPNSVIKGMLSGIGFVIILKQIPHAVGYDKDPEGDWEFEQIDGHNTFTELYYMLDDITIPVMIITAISLAILILWERPFIKNTTWGALIPGPLLTVILGVACTLGFAGTSWQMAPEHLVSIPIINESGGVSSLIHFPNFGLDVLTNPLVWKTGIVIAVVASIETLLCVEATDKLDPYKRMTPSNLELKAQGIGNIFSGLIGGLPITQVIVRSSANIQSGGQTKLSAIIHGILLLLSIIILPSILNLIPFASLAAVLFMVGYKLAKPSIFKNMFQNGWMQFLPFAVTFCVLVGVDLLVGVGAGLGVAIFFILLNNYQTPFYYKLSELEGKLRIELSEDVTFLNKANILKTLKDIPSNTILEIDATRSSHIHPDVIEIIDDFKSQAKERNIELLLIGFERMNKQGVAINQQSELAADLEEHGGDMQEAGK